MKKIITILILVAGILVLCVPVTTLAIGSDNQPPVITAPASIIVTEDITSALTGISFSDPDAGSGTVTATFSVATGTLSAVSGSGVTISGSGTRMLTLSGSISDINSFIASSAVAFTTALNSTANVTLSVDINDGGNTGFGGALTDSAIVTLVVSAVNDAPVNNVPGGQTVTRDEVLVFSGSNRISVSDADAGGGSIRVTLWAANGLISLVGTTGLSFVVGDGSGDSSMNFEGTISDINSALNGLSYTPASGYTGAAFLQIVSDDLGLSGSGGSQTDIDTIDISVVPVYDTNDYSKLQTFLNQPSAFPGKSNGQRINAAYDPLNPVTWTGVVWSSGKPKRVLSIGASGTWYSKSLAGTLDLSGLSQMTYLLVTQNQLTSLNVSGAAALETIFCFDNRLTSLTLSGNTSLENIYGSGNRLTTLDLSGAPNLVGIQCNGNMLTALNVTANAALQNLYCGSNQLTSLDVSHNAMLASLSCEQNQLTQLDVRSNPALAELGVSYNQLTALDVSANPLLMLLACNDNELTALDVRTNTALTQLICSGNELAALDISRNTALQRLDCYNNQITSLNFAASPAVTYIDCHANLLTSLDLRVLTALEELSCSDNRLASIQTVYSGSNISAAANGKGYVEMRLYSPSRGDAPQVTAMAEARGPFVRWTESGTAVSLTETYTLETGRDYLLTAHFLSLASTAENGTAYTGGRFSLTPSVSGGEWTFDSAYFSRKGNTFTALKEGTSTITYTFSGASVVYEVTIQQSGLPNTGQDFSWTWILCGLALALAAAGMLVRRRITARSK